MVGDTLRRRRRALRELITAARSGGGLPMLAFFEMAGEMSLRAAPNTRRAMPQFPRLTLILPRLMVCWALTADDADARISRLDADDARALTWLFFRALGRRRSLYLSAPRKSRHITCLKTYSEAASHCCSRWPCDSAADAAIAAAMI